jgi:hypothetical protein
MKILKLVSAVAIALASQAASAGVIQVMVDDFNGVGPITSASPTSVGLASGGTFEFLTGAFFNGTTTSGVAIPNAGLTSSVNNGGNGVLSVSADAGYTYTARLTYAPGIVLPTGATAQLTYNVVRSDQAGGSITPGGVVPVGDSGPYLGSYTGGNIVLNFASNATRAWDFSLDLLQLNINCANEANTTGAISIADYTRLYGQKTSCANVPVPGSLALLGLGGIAAGLVSRRRASAKK